MLRWLGGGEGRAALLDLNKRLVSQLEEVSVQNSLLMARLARCQQLLLGQAREIARLRGEEPGLRAGQGSAPPRAGRARPPGRGPPCGLEHRLHLAEFDRTLAEHCPALHAALLRQLDALAQRELIPPSDVRS